MLFEAFLALARSGKLEWIARGWLIDCVCVFICLVGWSVLLIDLSVGVLFGLLVGWLMC